MPPPEDLVEDNPLDMAWTLPPHYPRQLSPEEFIFNQFKIIFSSLFTSVVLSSGAASCAVGVNQQSSKLDSPNTLPGNRKL